MRIDGYHSSLYPHQAPSSVAPGVDKSAGPEEKSVQIKKEPVLPEAERETPPFLPRLWEQTKKDGQVLYKKFKMLLATGRELLKKLGPYLKMLVKKAEEMIGRLGNPGQQEPVLEGNEVAPLTWGQSFRQRVKIFFEAATGFLTSHLPMNNGSFLGAKKENKEELSEEKKDNGNQNPKRGETGTGSNGAGFDMRG